MAIDMPNVFDFVLLQELMHVLADSNQAIFVTARDPKQLQFRFRFFDVGNKLFGGFGVRGCGKGPTQAKVSRFPSPKLND